MEQIGEGSFYVTLSSAMCTECYPSNCSQQFKIQFSRPIVLSGKWDVALAQIICTGVSHNVPEDFEFIVSSRRALDATSSAYSSPGRRSRGNLARCVLRKGNHETLGDLCAALNRAIYKVVRHYSLNQTDLALVEFTYDQQSQRVTLSAGGNDDREDSEDNFIVTVYSTKGFGLLFTLGFHPDLDYNDRLAVLNIPVAGDKFPVLPTETRFVLVKCDLVDHQIYGDSQLRFLRIVPCEKSGRIDTQAFGRLQYVSVSKGYINNVTIELVSEPGMRASIKSGTTIVVLHFRKRDI